MILYKYFSLSEEKHKNRMTDLLLKNQIYLSDPSKFNDPFDRPKITFDGSKSAWDKKIDEVLPELLKRINSINASPATKLKLRNKYRRRSRSKKFESNFNRNLHDFFSVICLSKNNNNILMWSHYADSHKGICLGFRLKYLEEDFEHMFRIRYEKKYPKISLLDTDNPLKFLEAFNTKYVHWEYEQEIRVVNLHPPQVVYFSEELIESVYLGSEISKQNKDFITDLLNKRNLKINLYKSTKDIHNFRLNFDLINY